MFPLAGRECPATPDQLAAAIGGALAQVFTLAGQPAVTVAGDALTAIAKLSLNLDNAILKTGELPPRPQGVGDRRPGATVDRLDVAGHPIRYQGAALDFGLTARNVRFDFDRDSAGQALLVLADAADGTVDAAISKADLQAVLLDAATVAAKQQGVAIQDLHVDVQARGARTIVVDARVKAKKMMMSGVVNVSGQLDIDDELVATVSNLRCTGEGMIGGAAAGMLQPKLKSYEGTKVPLMSFSLGDVTLRDLTIKVDDAIHVTAAFGS